MLGVGLSNLIVVPMTRDEANAFVSSYHRHSKRVASHRFAIGASDGTQLWGVAIVANPVARLLQDGFTAEIRRVCVRPGAPKGTCSFLYGRCWRIWQQMGGRRMVTYTLASESGASLRGAGWHHTGELRILGQGEGWENRPGRAWQPVHGQLRLRWERR